MIVNGHPLIPVKPAGVRREAIPVAVVEPGPRTPPPAGTRDQFKRLGPEKFAAWVLEQPRLFVTDTTFRDAHQSLLATRMRHP